MIYWEGMTEEQYEIRLKNKKQIGGCANHNCCDCGGSVYEELQCHLCKCDWGIKICEHRCNAPFGYTGERYYFWECKKCAAVKKYNYDKMWRCKK